MLKLQPKRNGLSPNNTNHIWQGTSARQFGYRVLVNRLGRAYRYRYHTAAVIETLPLASYYSK